MPPIPDATELGNQAVRLRLISEDQFRDCMQDLAPNAPAAELLAILERRQFLSAWQSNKLGRGDFDGYFLGGNKLLYKIASGSFGRVWRAADPSTGAATAVKVLRRRWFEFPEKIDAFEREGKLGLKMRHPNIVQILAVNCDRRKQEYYIVMEFVEGQNLRDLLARRNTIPPLESIRIIEEAAAGLAYAYQHGLTHRDIKPSNILLATNGTAKLVDFGLADITRSMPGLTDDEDVVVDRTVDYAGLEKATGVKSGDVRSDIFFLGGVLYEMLSGRPALAATKDKRARMLKQRFDNIVSLTKADVDASPSVFNLLDRMLAMDPQQRFQTPSQLYDAIRQVHQELSGGPTAGQLTPEGPRTVFIVEKNPKFQDLLRDKFKALGYRVLVSIDPTSAVQRFKQQPFHALLLDLGTIGNEGFDSFLKLRDEAAKSMTKLATILLVSDDQAEIERQTPANDSTAILRFPLKKGELEKSITDLLKATE
jgi:serine/threonine protein kinase